MKIKFKKQKYQLDAVDSIVDIFEGQKVNHSLFTIDMSSTNSNPHIMSIVSEDLIGFSNKLDLTDEELLINVNKIQERNGLPKSKNIQGRNFTIEMETGTGKTYVYTRTIFELNRKYGFTKFIIVVPSVAIREGVNKSLQLTKEHFDLEFNNPNYNFFIYDSNKLSDVQSFSTSSNIEIMIINIASFNRSFIDIENENNTANIIHRESDQMNGNKPIDLIASTNPIVIIDEPQSVDNTKKAKEAIKSLNPLFTLRYSATHKEVYNLMYRLTPVDAYQKNLVKQIEVSSVTSEEVDASPYVRLISTSEKNGYSARIEINEKNKDGSIRRKIINNVKIGEDIWELSGNLDYYEDKNYIVDNIGAEKDNQFIEFTNGIYLEKGQSIGEIDPDLIKRAQIRETISLHLDKEMKLMKKGIKVLSLFFIDKVENYRMYDDDGTAIKGKYARWFEEEYNRLIKLPKYNNFYEKYKEIISFDSELVHAGYFSVDRKGRFSNTRGNTLSDESTYELIMKNKEKLLSFAEPTRFIFSHSALKEGWDNPNVFQVCTLLETKDTLTKRQKIGRGLRIPVNQEGERVEDSNINILSVIANESYKDFAEGLQKEFKEAGYNFGIIEILSFKGMSLKGYNNEMIEISSKDSKNIYEFLIKSNYLDKQGKVQEKFYEDVKNNLFKLNEDYAEFKDLIIDKIISLSKEVEIKDKNKRVEINIDENKFNSPEFNKLWSIIKRKSFFEINMDIKSLINNASKKISLMDPIKAIRLDRNKVHLNITDKGVKEGRAQYKRIATYDEFENISYPDILRRLQESTGLLRKTIAEILIKSNRLEDFYLNPEQFIKQVSIIINNEKKETISSGLKYYKSDDYFIVEEIFDDQPIFGYLDKDSIKSKGNNLYDHIKYDSEIEKEFGLSLDNDDDVILYTKLPNKFLINTPFGNYNPDWAIMLEHEPNSLYFIVETKGSKDQSQLRISENYKINCAKKHIEIIGDDQLKYLVTNNYKDLK